VPKQYGQACPVAKSLEFLGERWTLLIVRDLFTGPKKFHDLLKSLKGVAPGILSHRLKVLEGHRILTRRQYSEHPPRAEYRLSERGLELRPVVRAFAVWGARHLNPGSALVHDRCETAIEMAYYCPSCNELISANAASYHRTTTDPGVAGGRRHHAAPPLSEPSPAPDRTHARRGTARAARRSPRTRRSTG
jgi:DNA-binding HxlR family transcriptional regulator